MSQSSSKNVRGKRV